jgi:hypothetical protein
MFSRIREWMQGNIEDKTSRLNAQMRRDLAEEIERDLAIDPSSNSCSEALIKELNQTLDDSRALLNQLEENELFLDMRIKSYRNLLEEMQLRSEEGDMQMDENTLSPSILTERQEKQKQCAQLLQGVVNNHKGLLADIILQKRRCELLERIRDDLLLKQKECQDFLDASRKIDEQEAMSQQHTTDIEMASVT